MAYTPLDTTLIAGGSPLAAVVAREAIRNAAWLYDNRLHAWSCYWPAGAYDALDPDTTEQADWANVAGMVYAEAHGEVSQDYSGLYISTCPGEPLAAPLPVALSGRSNRVRITMTVRFEEGTTGAGGSVWMWAQLVIAGATHPRPFSPDTDLVRSTPSVPQLASVDYPNAVELTANGTDGWTTVRIDVDIPDTFRDWAPVQTGAQGVPQLLLCVMSEPASVADEDAIATFANYGVTHTVVPGGVQVRQLHPGAPSVYRTGPKPHMVLKAALPTEDGVEDAARSSLHHVLCVRRYNQATDDFASFVWPPLLCQQNDEGPIDAATIRTYDCPAVRILSIRIEEAQQP